MKRKTMMGLVAVAVIVSAAMTQSDKSSTETVSYELSYRDFPLNERVCTFDDNWCGWADYWPKAVIYGWMKTNVKIPEGADKLKVTVHVCSNGWGEGLAIDYGLWTNNSGIQIIVDDAVWYNKINESTIKSEHHHSYYKHDYGESFSTDFFNVSGKDNITLTIRMIDGARLDFCNVTLTFEIPPTTFDTGYGTYPSIMGTHKGEIIPSDNLTVSKLYTYACPGTGGHTEYIELCENGILIANGTWEGYKGDWHNITLHNVSGDYVILLKGLKYNYTIVTGSYPQIIHAHSKEVTGGTITCTSFVDTNGRKYNDWIPAIRLE